MPQISKGLRQAYELQDFTFEAAMALRNGLKGTSEKLTLSREDAQSISSLVKAWESCQQRIQVHRRVPNPGSLKPESKPSKKTKSISFPTENPD